MPTANFDIIDILLSLPAVFLAISFHEFAHAFAAHLMGDPTPKHQGRLTLDPIAHVDWIGLIMFAVFGFGWAKPVQVNTSNFKNRKWGNIIVSLAGPVTNLFLALFAFIILLIFELSISKSTVVVGMVDKAGILYGIFEKTVFLNIVFAILNLVPIPPFDGYQILKSFLFRKYANFFWQYERYSILILFAMILLNVFYYIVHVPAMYIYSILRYIGFVITHF